jgi:hypothetical protein
MKRGSFKFAIEAHNYTYSVNGASFEVEFTIEPVTSPPKGVFYPGYVLPAWGGLVNGVDPQQHFLVDEFDELRNVPSEDIPGLIPLPDYLSARFNNWTDNSTILDASASYNYTDYRGGDFRLGSSGTLRLSRFYSDDNTRHWQTFPPGYTFAGYADPDCSGNVVLTVRIRFPRPLVTLTQDPNVPIDYIWDPVMHFGGDSAVPSNQPVFDPKAPPYRGRAYLGNKYAGDRSLVAKSATLSAGGIVGIVVAGAVVTLGVVVAVVRKLRGNPGKVLLKQPSSTSVPSNPTHDLIHI